MPKPIEVLINWSRLTALQMAAFAHSVSQKMSALASTFPSPPVTPAEMDRIANELELAYANRKNGALAKTQFEDIDKRLDAVLHNVADYVNSVARGSKAVIESAGFTATSDERKHPEVPLIPAAPKISGNAALVHLQTDSVNGAASYCWVIFTNGDGNATVSETHITINGSAIIIPDGRVHEDLRNVIAAGTKITVQVLAQNTAGKSGFSMPVSLTIGG